MPKSCNNYNSRGSASPVSFFDSHSIILRTYGVLLWYTNARRIGKAEMFFAILHTTSHMPIIYYLLPNCEYIVDRTCVVFLLLLAGVRVM